MRFIARDLHVSLTILCDLALPKADWKVPESRLEEAVYRVSKFARTRDEVTARQGRNNRRRRDHLMNQNTDMRYLAGSRAAQQHRWADKREVQA